MKRAVLLTRIIGINVIPVIFFSSTLFYSYIQYYLLELQIGVILSLLAFIYLFKKGGWRAFKASTLGMLTVILLMGTPFLIYFFGDENLIVSMVGLLVYQPAILENTSVPTLIPAMIMVISSCLFFTQYFFKTSVSQVSKKLHTFSSEVFYKVTTIYMYPLLLALLISQIEDQSLVPLTFVAIKTVIDVAVLTKLYNYY